jgi:hypothetical protein
MKKKQVTIILEKDAAAVIKAFIGGISPMKAIDLYTELRRPGDMSLKRFAKLVLVEKTDALFKLYDQL